MKKSLTQLVKDAGFKINAKIRTDRIGIINVVTIEKDKKKTRRTSRKYDEALEACAVARGLTE